MNDTADSVALIDRHRGPALGLAAAARSGELGLPHALHGELIGNDDPDRLAARAVDVVTAVLGPCRGTVHALTSDDAWTLSIRWLPGVVVTLLIGRGTGSVHRYRVLGSNGQAYADLAGPSFDLVADEVTPIAFGPTPESRAGSAAEIMPSEITWVLDAARASSESGQPEPVGG